jgi:hypothetical protein
MGIESSPFEGITPFYIQIKKEKTNKDTPRKLAKTGGPTTGQSIDARLQASTLFHRLAD